MYEGDIKKTDELVKNALCVYADREQLRCPEGISEWTPENIKIKRTENGKPFFENVPEIRFSVSHTGLMWVCLMADFDVGIDIQEMRPVKSEEIAGRYFGPEEEHYVALWGNDGFIDIWVRKEALVKYKGSTLAREISLIQVAQNGDLLDWIMIDGKKVFFESIDMGLQVKCAFAAEKKEEICMQILY